MGDFPILHKEDFIYEEERNCYIRNRAEEIVLTELVYE